MPIGNQHLYIVHSFIVQTDVGTYIPLGIEVQCLERYLVRYSMSKKNKKISSAPATRQNDDMIRWVFGNG